MNWLNKIIKTLIEEFEINSKVCLVDVGASGGINTRWNLINDNLQIIGFEPNKKEFIKLINSEKYIWFNKALYSEKCKKKLYVSECYSNTSLLKPNYKVIDKLYYNKPDIRKSYNIIKEEYINCDKLDNILIEAEIKPDVIKLDTQGTELEILKGTNKNLNSNFFAVEIEIEFVQLYQEQPLFTDIHKFLIEKNFILMDYGNIMSVKGANSIGVGQQKGQIIVADGLYFKSLDSILNMLNPFDIEKFYKIILTCLSYGYVDYAVEICTCILNDSDIKNRTLHISNENLKKMLFILKKFKRTAQYIPNFYGKKFLKKILKQLLSVLTKTEHIKWINTF